MNESFELSHNNDVAQNPQFRCVVVDDEPLAMEMLASYVNKTAQLTLVGKFTSATSAMTFVQQNEVDVLFLDIQMPDLNGLELARLIPQNVKVVFTTAFSQYAIESYKVGAVDYLLKPISFVDFQLTVQRLVQRAQPVAAATPKTEEEDVIYVNSMHRLCRIELSKLLYVEAQKDYVCFFMEDEEPIRSISTLKSLEKVLGGDRFMRVHRSFVVQKSKIKVVENGAIVFGKVSIPVGEAYKEDFRQYIHSKQV